MLAQTHTCKHAYVNTHAMPSSATSMPQVVLLPYAAHAGLQLVLDPAHPGYRHTTLSFEDLLHQGADRSQARPGDILGTAVNLKVGIHCHRPQLTATHTPHLYHTSSRA